MKRPSFAMLILVLLSIGVVSATMAQNQDVAARAAIEEANVRFVEAWNQGDATAFAALYTKDAQLMLQGSEPLVGRETIREAIQAAFNNMGTTRLTVNTKEFQVMGDTAYWLGEYVIESADGKHLDHGPYMALWKKEEGHWRIHREVGNSSVTPQQ